jgi:hypothetical protein
MDFESLYPSVIEEMNICPSTSISRSKAAHLGLKVLTPPAPSLSGAWMTPHGLVSAVEDYHVTPSIVTFTSPGGVQRTLQFTNELNEAVADAAGKANLEELGYALRWDNGELWTRRDEDVLCFVDADVRCGIMPQLERDLKVERKQAKRDMAAAEAAGDEAAYAFHNNKQASIKVRAALRLTDSAPPPAAALVVLVAKQPPFLTPHRSGHYERGLRWPWLQERWALSARAEARGGHHRNRTGPHHVGQKGDGDEYVGEHCA